MLLFLLSFRYLCAPVVPLWFHPAGGDTVRTGARWRWRWALSLGLCLWQPGASLSADRAGSRAALLAESCHTQSLPHLRLLLVQGAQGQHAGLASEGLSCVQSSGLVHLAAISLPWAGCHSRLQHPGGLRVCSQLSKTAEL